MNTSIIFWGMMSLFLLGMELYTVSLMFLFMALSAATVCVLLLVVPGVILGFMSQAVVFLGLSVMYALVFYKPFKRYIQMQGQQETYSNIIGSQAICEEGLQQGQEGRVRWSGTVCRAVLMHGSTQPGDVVEIVEVKGNIFNVVKKGV